MRYGGKNIQMTAEEVNHIRACGQDTNFLRLLGFRYTSQCCGAEFVLHGSATPFQSKVLGNMDSSSKILIKFLFFLNFLIKWKFIF